LKGGKRVLVTGGSRGLGRAIGLAFAREGARVAFSYVKNEAAAKETQEALGDGALAFRANAWDAGETDAMVRAVETAWGGIDVLVNNAAVTQNLPDPRRLPRARPPRGRARKEPSRAPPKRLSQTLRRRPCRHVRRGRAGVRVPRVRRRKLCPRRDASHGRRRVMTMKLYDGQRSPNARKVRLLAAELGTPLELVAMDFRKGDFRKPDFLALSPSGKIPVLDDDGFVIFESAAILKYLAKKRPDAGLVPLDPKGLARLDQWMFWWAAHVEPALLALVREKLVKPFLGQGDADATLVADAYAALARFLPVLEKEVGDRKYLLGEQCVFDFDVAPWLALATTAGLGVDLAPYPNLTAWLGRMEGKPYWKDA
jgi:glutathione S-transferase